MAQTHLISIDGGKTDWPAEVAGEGGKWPRWPNQVAEVADDDDMIIIELPPEVADELRQSLESQGIDGPATSATYPATSAGRPPRPLRSPWSVRSVLGRIFS